MNFTRTRISLKRPWHSYTKVQTLVGLVIRNRKWHLKPDRVASLEYLDVGCGPNIRPEVLSLDYQWRPGLDICWDVTRGLPLADDSLAGVFSEHCLEHLALADVFAVLREFARVLMPGGTLRLVLPDAEFYLDIYQKRRSTAPTAAAPVHFPYEENDVVNGVYSPIMSVNRIFRGSGHLYMYDFPLLREMLEHTGFSDVRKESFGHARDPRLILDTESRAVESLYAEATKPQQQDATDG